MKKIVLLLCAVLLLGLCACGGAPEEAPPAASPAAVGSPAAAESEAPAAASAEPAAPSREPSPVPGTPEAQEAPTPREIAESYVGRDVEALIAELGEPEAREYQDSCEKPDTQDGFLDYEGFTVVTSKDSDRELVQRVDDR